MSVQHLTYLQMSLKKVRPAILLLFGSPVPKKTFPEALRLLDDPALKLDPLDMSCVSALEAACNNNAQELALKLLEKGG